MLQAPGFECLSFDPFSLQQNGLAASEVDVGGREVIQALVIALMVVVIDERFDLGFEICREEVVVQQDTVLQGLMPTLDLALCLWVIRRPADMTHVPVLQPFGQVAGYVAGAVVRQQSRFVNDIGLIAS